MVQTHVLLCCEQHLHHGVGVWQRGALLYKKRGHCICYCWKWDSFNNLLHTWYQSVFFPLRQYTNFVLSADFSFATLCAEALKIICQAGAWCWISEGCFCWFRGKSILQRVQPAKCPISAVKKKKKKPHRGRIGITFCEFWSHPCQGLTRGNQWLHRNIKLCHKL